MSIIAIQRTKDVTIQMVTGKYEHAAKSLVLEGLEERFGFLDSSFNDDLNTIIPTYIHNGDVFLIGLLDSDVVCTGALTYEGDCTGRIERMSVRKTFRKHGLARLMLSYLEKYAKEKHYTELVLETNNTWTSAVRFYEKHGFQPYLYEETRTHFKKSLS